MPIINESPCDRVGRPARVMIEFIVAGYTQYPQMPNPTHPITAYISGISASRRFSRAANESAAHSSTNPTVYTNATANRQATRNHGIRANAPPAALTITGALTSSHTHMTKAMETACTSIVGNPVSLARHVRPVRHLAPFVSVGPQTQLYVKQPSQNVAIRCPRWDSNPQAKSGGF